MDLYRGDALRERQLAWWGKRILASGLRERDAQGSALMLIQERIRRVKTRQNGSDSKQHLATPRAPPELFFSKVELVIIGASLTCTFKELGPVHLAAVFAGLAIPFHSDILTYRTWSSAYRSANRAEEFYLRVGWVHSSGWYRCRSCGGNESPP